jgi:hypothetical protein
MSHANDQKNINSQMMLGIFNMSQQLKAGQMKAKVAQAHTQYNVSLIRQTMNYNDNLLEQEETRLWESMGLDLKLLEKQRSRERGSIVGKMAASGTTIGVGSNKDIVVEQKTQEALDAFVITHNADLQAAKIKNARAKNEWQGNMEIQKTIYNGEMGTYVDLTNARNAATSIGMQTMISGQAGIDTSNYALASGMSGAEQRFNANGAQIQQNFTAGMFSAASSAVSAYGSYGDVGGGTDSLLSNSTAQVDHYGR